MRFVKGNCFFQDAVLDRYTQYGNDSHQQQMHASSTQLDWVRNKHIGKKGEFRYF